MPKPPLSLNTFESLVQVVEELRGPNGCPWDKEQTHQSLTRYAIEECYEFIEAVNNGDFNEMKDELGDVLLQVVLHAEIAKQNNNFTISDIIENINKKMIRRHPHVFSNETASTSKEVLLSWEEIKKKERAHKKEKMGFGVPTGLSPLIKSLKLGEKAAKQKFDWENTDQIIDKIKEETEEVIEAIDSKKQEDILHEIGDILFATCQLARKLNINPETALQKTNTRFEQRFFKMKTLIESENKRLEDLSLNEMEEYWQKIKKKQ